VPPVDEQQGESAVELFEFDVINESYVVVNETQLVITSFVKTVPINAIIQMYGTTEWWIRHLVLS
jgi:hypothetical protein